MREKSRASQADTWDFPWEIEAASPKEIDIGMLHETFPPLKFLFHVCTSIPSQDISKNGSKTSEN